MEEDTEISDRSGGGGGSRLFAPYRQIGSVCGRNPVVLRKRGKESFLLCSFGRSMHIMNVAKMHVVSMGTNHARKVRAVAARDDLTFVANGMEIAVWRRGQRVGVMRGHTGKITLLCVFGNHVVSLSASSRMLFLHCIDSFDVFDVLELPFEPSAIVHPMTYLNKMLIGGLNGELQLWNLKTKKLIYSFDGFGSTITALDQSPVCHVIGIGCLDGKIVVLNLEEDAVIVSFSLSADRSVTSLCFRRDGQATLVVGDSRGQLSIWDLQKQCLSMVVSDAHNAEISSVTFLPNEPIMITSGGDNAIKKWIFDSLDGLPRVLAKRSGHESPVSLIRSYRNPRFKDVLSADGNGCLRCFNPFVDAQSFEFSQKALLGDRTRLDSVRALSRVVAMDSSCVRERDFENIVTVHENDPNAYLWRYTNKTIASHVCRPSSASSPSAIASVVIISSCGNHCIVGYDSGMIEMFNCQSGRSRRSFCGHEDRVTGIASDATNSYIVSTSLDATMKWFDFYSARLMETLSFDLPIVSMTFHRESAIAAVITQDFVVRVFDLDTRQLVRRFDEHSSPILDVAFSPDARWLATASDVVRIFDLVTATQIDSFEDTGLVCSLDFSTDGIFLMTACVSDRSVHFWGSQLTKPDGIERSPVQLSLADTNSRYLTFSEMSAAQWRVISEVSSIKDRNKPRKLQDPIPAPFFLPTVAGLVPTFVPSKEIEVIERSREEGGSKIKQLSKLHQQNRLIACLREKEDAVAYLKGLSPSAIDLELRTLSLENDFEELRTVLCFLMEILDSFSNFEFFHALLALFLEIHGASLAEHPLVFQSLLQNLKERLGASQDRFSHLVDANLCLVGFLSALPS